jgi:hypothetical protein
MAKNGRFLILRNPKFGLHFLPIFQLYSLQLYNNNMHNIFKFTLLKSSSLKLVPVLTTRWPPSPPLVIAANTLSAFTLT